MNQRVDSTNPLAPVKTDKEMVNQLVFPEEFESVNKFVYKAPKAEEIYGEEQRLLDGLKNVKGRPNLPLAGNLS